MSNELDRDVVIAPRAAKKKKWNVYGPRGQSCITYMPLQRVMQQRNFLISTRLLLFCYATSCVPSEGLRIQNLFRLCCLNAESICGSAFTYLSDAVKNRIREEERKIP